MFDLKDFYCYIPLNGNGLEIKPKQIGYAWGIHIDPLKCQHRGTAKFGNNTAIFDVFAQNVETGYHQNRQWELVNFIMIPKNVVQRFDIEIVNMRYGGGYFYGTSDITTDFGLQVKLEHVLTCKDLHSYIDAGGSVLNKHLQGNFKFANIKISNTKFVSV